ncbi:hypothetical protein [Brevibacillus laterosporus]|uniref:Uncharacterized protein n=1 Tax=Brevibacillus laterosporus TaxID=1465 RepID=A0AAP3DKR3_BRELA|nr:hypothetical protein [Brevibacillus laterosporus]MCR8983103.1 hypothetical protein [Brevibacillus laterosporus]MCZ0810259.1 hypothetical protein [Brevibacillus laterosporus]MCZ0828857.1 hypothetical protein [Brevibacillus laterosporus]MCZ0852898.1 hypothetical protein [Brevibacillus laterosporus]
MRNNQKDIKNLQLFQIIRQQYIGQLVESFKQAYHEKNSKEPNKKLIEAFMNFLEKETDLTDKMVESAFRETMDHLKENTSIEALAVTTIDHPPKKTSNNFVEKFREIVVAPILIGALIYAITTKDLVITILLLVLLVLLAFGWWKGRET